VDGYIDRWAGRHIDRCAIVQIPVSHIADSISYTTYLSVFKTSTAIKSAELSTLISQSEKEAGRSFS
jgi:hypothetical protein